MNCPKNWVTVIEKVRGPQTAEFTVSPSIDPTIDKKNETIEHFFAEDATSTFRIERIDRDLVAREIGKNEIINNSGAKSKNRKIINTIIAHGGWAGLQKFQWEKLTDFLVHIEN